MSNEKLKATLDRANPNTMADILRALKIGTTLSCDVKQTRRKVDFDTAGADSYNLATLDVLKLPDDAKAISIFRAYSKASGGTNGELAVQAFATTPADGQIAVTPSGDIAVLAASAYTDVDIEYMPARGEVYEVTLDGAASVFAIPSWMTDRGVAMLLEAESLVGTLTGKMIILKEGAAPATTKANLNVARTQVLFAVADAVTQARLKFLVAPKTTEDLTLQLESDSSYV